MKPAVSVLVTAYNREKYIAECVQSILDSTFTDFEVVIVDDASTDGTARICSEFQQKDPRVKLFVNEKNLGQFANRNRAASLATADLIKYFDSDDVIYKETLQLMVDAMNTFPEASAGIECRFEKTRHGLPHLFSPRECYVTHYFEGNDMLYVGPGGAIFRKQAFWKVGGFNADTGILADTHLMLALAAHGPVVGLQPGTFFWRLHDEQVTVGQKDYFDMLVTRKKINELILDLPECPLSTSEKALVHRNLKNIFIRNLPKNFYKLKSPSKMVSLLKAYKISYADLLRSLKANKKIAS